MRAAAASAALLLLLAGCAVGPDYRRPAVDAPGAWLVPEEAARETADTAWWAQFGDPVLDNLVADALRGNLDVKIAAARVTEFEGRYAVARGGLLPEAGVGASVDRERLTRQGLPPLSGSAPDTGTLHRAALGASWEIDLWGKYRRVTEAARADLLATGEGRRGTILSLVSDTVSGYVTLRGLDRQLAIARQTAAARAETYRLFDLRFRGGLVSELERVQAKSEYEQALSDIPQLERAIAFQEHALSALLGKNPGAIPRGLPIEALSVPDVPAGLPSTLLARRPDLRAAEQALVAANARIGVARAAWFPAISLTGALGATSTELSSLFSGPARAWNFGAALTVPVFAGGAIAGNVKAAEAVREQQLLAYRRAIRNAFRDAEDALSARRSARDQAEALDRQVATLRELVRLARLRYDNGYTSHLDVLDAERSLFNGELARARARGDLCVATVALYKAMGGGWVARAEALSAP
jgi:multidrug efflux system outer membrane protein